MQLTPEQIARFAEVAKKAEQKPRGTYSGIFPYVAILRGKGFQWQEVVDKCKEVGIEVSRQTLQSQFNHQNKKAAAKSE